VAESQTQDWLDFAAVQYRNSEIESIHCAQVERHGTRRTYRCKASLREGVMQADSITRERKNERSKET
jgi:hypothetical protein